MNPNKIASIDVTVHIVKAFTKDGTGGNPAGVVLDADALSEEAMQAIAARVGVSETAFVSRSVTEGARLDFFTPTRRIAHCGHATIGAFALLRAQGRIADGMTSKETVDGPRRILVRDGVVFMEQRAPRYQPLKDRPQSGIALADTLDALGLEAPQLDARFLPQVVDTGNRFLLLGVKQAADLAAITPDIPSISRISEALDMVGFYPFTTANGSPEADAFSRMFAPRFGIAEESATGMAAGPLACLLHDALGLGRERLVIEQGRYMRPSAPSRIFVELERQAGRITGLMVGGQGQVGEMRRLRIATSTH